MVEAIEFVCAGKVWVLQTGYSSFVSGAVAYREQYDANDFRRDFPIQHAGNRVGRIGHNIRGDASVLVDEDLACDRPSWALGNAIHNSVSVVSGQRRVD